MNELEFKEQLRKAEKSDEERDALWRKNFEFAKRKLSFIEKYGGKIRHEEIINIAPDWIEIISPKGRYIGGIRLPDLEELNNDSTMKQTMRHVQRRELRFTYMTWEEIAFTIGWKFRR